MRGAWAASLDSDFRKRWSALCHLIRLVILREIAPRLGTGGRAGRMQPPSSRPPKCRGSSAAEPWGGGETRREISETLRKLRIRIGHGHCCAFFFFWPLEGAHDLKPREPRHAHHGRAVRGAPHPLKRCRFPCAVFHRPPTQTSTAKIPGDQLDSLVAPIALLSGPAPGADACGMGVYPLEIIQLQQWMAKHPDLKGEALAAAVEKENWDPAVQGLAGLPDVVKRLADDIAWTTDLGNAFLAQQSDVMDAVQRMRRKASDAGNLKTTEQQKVTTQVVQTHEVIVIQQANPQVIYVPAYNPVVVYGPPIYPYPPIYYPPIGYYAGRCRDRVQHQRRDGRVWDGGWGYGPRWGYGSVHINVNNRYVNHYNRYNGYNRYGGNWNHNPVHRERRNAVHGSQHREPLWRRRAGRCHGRPNSRPTGRTSGSG